MLVRIFEPGGERPGVHFERTVVRGTLRIGGAPPCEVVVPQLGVPGPIAELEVGARGAELRRVGEVRVAVGGRELSPGQGVRLGPEVLLALGELELVFSSLPPAEGGSRPAGALASAEHPSTAARELLKEVYAALGVPEEHPGLIVHDRAGKVVGRFELSGQQDEITIGRHPDNQIVLYDASVSKRHARVVRDGIGYFVEDLGSRNGTEVEGERVRGRRRLRSGERIRIGAFQLRFLDPKQAVADLAGSVPDLHRMPAAGGQLRVGGAGDAADTLGGTGERPAPAGAAPAPTASPPQLELAARPALLPWLLVGLGVLILAGLAALLLTAL
ncbi:MAG: hypothetical protein KatS3mg102_1035 [Planctomycetota bacterium]|nr:MAG: hypothetical protein KatS3mg102_1035 [Planctomycetota bacterium]